MGVHVFYKIRILKSSQTNGKLNKIQTNPSKNTMEVAGLWVVASVFINTEFKKSIFTCIK